jgi:sugar (pentulose or hexulose) kinase
MGGSVAVLDVGKTNIKVIAFDADGQILSERRQSTVPAPPSGSVRYASLDTERDWRFFADALRELAQRHRIETISISAHGAAGALVNDAGLALPPIDYDDDELNRDAADYEALRPPFCETLSPNLPRGMNLGRQILHSFRHYPAEAAKVTAFLAWPQYWAWRLSGIMATEFTAMGSHTDLWRPYEGGLSSMVDKLGWRRLFPPLRKAWETLGPIRPEIAALTGLDRSVKVLCGAHDSNASLVPHLMSRPDPFTVISTGTWVIIFAVGSKASLDPAADMLANVNVRGEPVPCARFMGGREFAVLAGDAPPDVEQADIAAVVASGALALPAFSDQGGPFAGRKGRIEGELPDRRAARAALATLYSALMTDHLVGRLAGASPLIVDGGFAGTPAFATLLAALKPGRTVFIASAAGAAAGAAMLAHWGEPHPPPRLEPAPAWAIPGLKAYRERWERAL